MTLSSKKCWLPTEHSPRELAPKQRATAIVSAKRVTLTSILSQRERRPLLPLGEGWDEGSDRLSGDKDFKFETSERNFSEYMIRENYLEAAVGK